MVLILLALAAHAEDPPGGATEPAAQEVTVYGEVLVRQARDEVVKALKQAGYTEEIDRGDHVIYRSVETWRGEVVIYDDGYMVTKRQPVQLRAPETPWAEEGTPLAAVGCVVYPFLCVRPGGQLVGHRKFLAQESRAVDAAHDEVRVWSERVADLHTSERIAALPDRLQALWDAGTPLEGDGPPLATVAERKQALLAFWESRTDTPWGDQVRQATEAFLRGVVQQSDTPISPEELAAFNSASHAQRPLSLERPALPLEP